MNSVTQPGERPAGKRIGALVLAAAAVLLIAAGIMFFIEPAKDLLIFSLKSPPYSHTRADHTRPLWGVASMVLAMLCLAGAWVAVKGNTGPAVDGQAGEAQGTAGSDAPTSNQAAQ